MISSIFSLHNETGELAQPLCPTANLKAWLVVNIHSHLFGACLFGLLPWLVFAKMPSLTGTLVDVLVLGSFFYSVALCFLLSAL